MSGYNGPKSLVEAIKACIDEQEKKLVQIEQNYNDGLIRRGEAAHEISQAVSDATYSHLGLERYNPNH